MSLVLCILDGWGVSSAKAHNAIYKASTPFYDSLIKDAPCSLIGASGADVGLPIGQMGNSEVGHMAIGSGRIIEQKLVAIKKQLEAKDKSPDFKSFLKSAKNNTCHILGLFSDGGVHSDILHINLLVDCLQKNNSEVYLHAFLDGRDTPPKSALNYVKGNGLIKTICGRYYAMDRDSNWDRTKLAYDLITKGLQTSKEFFTTAEDAILHYYSKEITDEFITPTKIGDYHGIKDGDCVFIANFRADRARQISSELFGRTNRLKGKKNLKDKMTMCQYFEDFSLPIFFKEKKIKNTLAQVIADSGMQQLKIAETEKYPHVTYFFNGGKEEILEGEERVMIDSASVATYNMQPEMSAKKITEALVKNILSSKYDIIVANYANADMVGHTGDFDATVKAIDALDICLKKVYQACQDKSYKMLITADHGNAECMYDYKEKMPHTYHTTNKVPFIALGDGLQSVKNGKLCDIMPTILNILGLEKPHECSGQNLILANQKF